LLIGKILTGLQNILVGLSPLNLVLKRGKNA
jgi:hypothetical protein